MIADTAAVRAGEELNLDALSSYLTGKIDGAEKGIEIEQFPGGHSNLTYLLKIGGKEYVLRRAPLGPVAPKAHDMARESKVLSAVNPHFAPAPKVYHLCEDPSVIGAVFFLMERRRGIILRDSIPPQVSADPEHPRRISEALVDCMVALHSIDIESTGLRALGKPEGFLERQVTGWADRWVRAKNIDVPAVEESIEWLKRRMPVSGKPTLVHNDYKLDNVMLRASNISEVEAVLDWEMTTVGDPLADLGLTLTYWSQGGSPDLSDKARPALNSGPGWYSSDEFIERYTRMTGRDTSAIGWHQVLGQFKLIVIIQQIYIRWVKGQTKDDRFRIFGDRVQNMAAALPGLMEKAG
jgi:aminoglycoside phosphotransferase (APT) family kinase protein